MSLSLLIASLLGAAQANEGDVVQGHWIIKEVESESLHRTYEKEKPTNRE